jgi:hypothetical protein
MWIAKWRDGGRQVQRGLGFVHSRRHLDGLTRAEGEAVRISRNSAEADVASALRAQPRTMPLKPRRCPESKGMFSTPGAFQLPQIGCSSFRC